MTKKITYVLAAVFLFAVPLATKFIFDKYIRYINLPFKCLTFTRYVLGDDINEIQMNISQDLRLYSLTQGYFLMNGTVRDGDKTSRIGRVIRLEKGSVTQGKTFAYKIHSIEKLDGDNTDDRNFNLLLNEYRTGSRDFQIDVFKIDRLTWLTGGPYSFINTCTRY